MIRVVDTAAGFEALDAAAEAEQTLSCSPVGPRPPVPMLEEKIDEPHLFVVASFDETEKPRAYMIVNTEGEVHWFVPIAKDCGPDAVALVRWCFDSFGAAFGYVQNPAVRVLFESPQISVDSGGHVRWTG